MHFQRSDFASKGSVILWIILILMSFAFVGVMASDEITRMVSNWLGIFPSGDRPPRHETLKFIGVMMSGVLAAIAAIGAIAVNRRTEAQTEPAKAQLKAVETQAQTTETQVKNNQLIEKGHINEQLKSTIENLGHSDASVRIASFYQFFRLAKEGERDIRHNIFEILCSRLRSMPRDISHLTEEDKQERPTTECQTLLDILFQPESEPVFGEFHANLRKAFLVYAGLTDANLVGAELSGADLMAAFLQRTNASHASFSHANLAKANFANANLIDTKFIEANLEEAHLAGANFTNANLMGANLAYAHIENADFTNAEFVGAHLTDTNLPFVHSIEGANFLWARIRDRDISPEDLPTNKGKYLAAWADDEFWKQIEKNRKNEV